MAITPLKSAVSGSPAANSIRAASAGASAVQIMIAVGGKPADARARGRQQAQLRPRQVAGANEQHRAGLQVEKHWQESHTTLAAPSCGVD